MNIQLDAITNQIHRLNLLISEQPTQKDPLINYNEEHLIYGGVFLLVISLIIGLGLLSRKLEYALLCAITLTLILILFFYSTNCKKNSYSKIVGRL